jgi:thiamine biosynthesis protein ThiI
MILPIVLVRFSEIALKSRNTRTALRRLLRHNVSTALKVSGLPFDRIEDTWERLIIYSSTSERVAETISKVFGVVSTSPAIECKAEINKISEAVSEMASGKLRQGNRFAIRVRRVGKHEFTTNQIARTCGSSVIETAKKAGIQVTVDLDSPDYEFFVEVRAERCFIYYLVIRGVGGLPIGSQGKFVSCLSDYESIIATWLVMKRGCTPILAVFDKNDQVDELMNLTKSLLLPYAPGKLPIVIIPLFEVIRKADSTGLKKCLEYLAMNDIALLEGAEGIVTSERTDPSRSDQMEALRGYGAVVDFPIFYPLVGLDEENLKRLAIRIGEGTLASKIGEKAGTPVTRGGGAKTDVACGLDSSLIEYREKIREKVLIAVEEVQF